MLALIKIEWLHWVGFITVVMLFLMLDLGVFHRRAHIVKFREAMIWTALWFSLAIVFSLGLREFRGQQGSLEFLTGYLIELSLSMDNVFVIALIFAYFGVPLQYQHRVLFWGILGALIMRGLMIWMGAELLKRVEWLLLFLGGFLVVTGVKMALSPEEEVKPENNLAVRLARRWFPVSAQYDGQKFVTVVEGQRMLTPLALVLLMVETTDLVFAVDSIPAIFMVTLDPFIIFTSNVFAILGLRSLYFVLAGAIAYFRYLKVGLSLVLIFIGIRMFVPEHYDLTTLESLVVVVSIIGLSIIASALAAWRGRRGATPPE